MKKSDYVILVLVGIYIFMLPFTSASRLEWLLSLIFCVIGMIYLFEIIFKDGERERFLKKSKVIFTDTFTIMFLLFIIVMFITTLNSKAIQISIKEFIRYVYYIGMYFVIRFRFDKEKIYMAAVDVYLFSTLVVGLIGILEFIKYEKMGLTIEQMILFSRVKSTFEHHNTYAAYLILAIFPAILIALNSKGLKRIYYYSISVILSFNLAVTFSKNGWIAFAVGILTLSILYSWKFISLYIIPAVYLFFSKDIYMRLIQILDSAYSSGRIKLWKIAESMIKENVFWGVGSGNFMTMYNQYVRRFPELELNENLALPPHNSYIRVFAEIGVFGAVIFLIMCFEMLKSVFYVRSKCSGHLKYFYSGYLISVMCFLMMNCFDDLFYTPKVTINFLIFVFISFNIAADYRLSKV
ncbi:MAG: O-antigen ligase family protein [Bacillota bacterium]|nr:O-antigen ligase family protein [Bacillota bacterium]